MDIPALGQHEQALTLFAQRNRVLASNIANADTPNYKARDIDFKSALSNARHDTISLQRTSQLHQQAWGTSVDGATTMYRIPSQATLDGNTVETDVEQAAFAENALQYRASLAFLDGRITFPEIVKLSEQVLGEIPSRKGPLGIEEVLELDGEARSKAAGIVDTVGAGGRA